MIALERGAQPPSGAVEQPEIRATLEHYEAATQNARDLDRQLVLLERNGRGRAEAADAAATADAIASGAKDPGSKHLTRYERELADAKRQASAAKLVEGRAWEAVQVAFREHGDELRQATERRLERARVAFLKALDDAERKHEELVSTLAWGTFFASEGMGHGIYRASSSATVPAPPVHAIDDTVVVTTELFAALRAVGALPPPPPITNPAQLRPDGGQTRRATSH